MDSGVRVMRIGTRGRQIVQLCGHGAGQGLEFASSSHFGSGSSAMWHLADATGRPWRAGASPLTCKATLEMQTRPKPTKKLDSYLITCLPGDGQGPAVMHEAKKVLKSLQDISGVTFKFQDGLIGNAAQLAVGNALPAETIDLCKSCDAVLIGGLASTTSHNGGAPLRSKVLMKLRAAMGLYWQLSPASAFPQMENDYPLNPSRIRGTDIIVVRELSGGIYTGPQGRGELPNGDVRAFGTAEYTGKQVERIARSAFDIARQRSRRLTSVDLANYLEVSVLWREIVTKLAKEEYADVEVNHELADYFATRLVQNPTRYDTVVAANLIGDVLVEVARGITGGVRFAPSAEFGEPGTPALFGFPGELGSRFTGTVNPFGLIRSVSMMLRYQFGLPVLADLLQQAIRASLEDGVRTKDMSSASSKTIITTEEMGDRIVQAMEYFQSFKVPGNPVEVGE
eukprot:TRINITY_DN793_c0_g1_i1.p1 TRINITY_DN793_c0_g1~~TRINITY_DN793_c0_g1_i1.p1  ORF type:complete len:480 (+),score=89.37 TRINITY_DN793_c0_g1_i1:81-1442(+)